MWPVNEIGRNSNAHSNARRGTLPNLGLDLMSRVLDEIDYGILVVDAKNQILHCNHLALHELRSGKIFISQSNTLLGSTQEITEQLEVAVTQACRGHRRLVLFNLGICELPTAFIPMSHSPENDVSSVLVLLSKQNSSANLAVRMFARTHGLTHSEEAVLISLCRGLAVLEIAQENGVAHSTVRSQVKSLREKTACTSIRQLMLRVNSLPPMVTALRIIPPMHHNISEIAHT